MAGKESEPTAAQRAERARLIRAASHPVRARALVMMAERAASPKEVAEALGLPVANVAYHVRELERNGLIKLVDKQKRRGATEHFYVLSSSEESARLSLTARELLTGIVVHRIVAESAIAAEEGTLDARADSHYSHVHLLLDEEGWRRAGEILDQALAEIIELRDRSEERLDQGGEKRIRATVGMLFFEMPPEIGEKPP